MIGAERWRLWRYDLPLRRALTTGGGLRRQGLILEARHGSAVGLGEAAPIPGYHPCSLDEVEAQLLRALRHDEPPGDAVARFCVEGAALSLSAARQDRRPAAVLSDAPAPRAPLNALIDTEDPAAQAATLAARGCTAAKIKVGRRSLSHEIAAIKAVAAATPEMRIRLDANRAWSLDEARRFCDALRGVEIDYLEEPLRDPGRLATLHAETGVRIGLDESLSEGVAAFPAGTAALVIKPTVVGGLSAARALVTRARAIGAQAVISATFETSVGLGLLAELACATCPTPPPQGLGTGRWLAGDVVAQRLEPADFTLSWRAPVLRRESLALRAEGPG